MDNTHKVGGLLGKTPYPDENNWEILYRKCENEIRRRMEFKEKFFLPSEILFRQRKALTASQIPKNMFQIYRRFIFIKNEKRFDWVMIGRQPIRRYFSRIFTKKLLGIQQKKRGFRKALCVCVFSKISKNL